MQFANKAETVFKWVLPRPYQTRFLESLAEMSGSSQTTTKNRRVPHPRAFHSTFTHAVFIQSDWNFLTKFCSSDKIFTRNTFTSLRLKCEISAYAQIQAYSFILTI